MAATLLCDAIAWRFCVSLLRDAIVCRYCMTILFMRLLGDALAGQFWVTLLWVNFGWCYCVLILRDAIVCQYCVTLFFAHYCVSLYFVPLLRDAIVWRYSVSVLRGDILVPLSHLWPVKRVCVHPCKHKAGPHPCKHYARPHSKRSSFQGILKGEVSLYHWPPVWLVWNQLYGNWQFLFLFAKQTNPNQSNRRSMVLWYFPL